MSFFAFQGMRKTFCCDICHQAHTNCTQRLICHARRKLCVTLQHHLVESVRHSNGNACVFFIPTSSIPASLADSSTRDSICQASIEVVGCQQARAIGHYVFRKQKDCFGSNFEFVVSRTGWPNRDDSRWRQIRSRSCRRFGRTPTEPFLLRARSP